MLQARQCQHQLVLDEALGLLGASSPGRQQEVKAEPGHDWSLPDFTLDIAPAKDLAHTFVKRADATLTLVPVLQIPCICSLAGPHSQCSLKDKSSAGRSLAHRHATAQSLPKAAPLPAALGPLRSLALQLLRPASLREGHLLHLSSGGLSKKALISFKPSMPCHKPK